MMLPDGEYVVCLDTNVLIWMFESHRKNPAASEMTGKALTLLNFVDRHGIRLGMSGVSLAEYLSVYPRERRLELMREIESIFEVYPFDIPAAEQCADIFYSHQHALKINYHGIRGILRPDLQIVASILTHCGKPLLITGDGPMSTWASEYLPAIKLSDLEL